MPIKDVSNAPFCDVPNLQHAVKTWDQGKELEVTHADLPILGAGGKIFSIGTEAHAADVQVTVLVCFVIDEYANLMLVKKNAGISNLSECTKSLRPSLHQKFARHDCNRLRDTSHRRRTLRSTPRYRHAVLMSATPRSKEAQFSYLS